MEPLGGIISELGRTQYNLGAVVLTLKAMGLSLGFWIVTLCLTTRVKGPFFFLKKKKRNKFLIRITRENIVKSYPTYFQSL